jgi:C4-dicarboxylate-specific signal transduction histidine kinase
LRGRTFAGSFAGLPDTSQFGLGLSVAAGIAHDHGGSLQTESDENGGGYLLRVAVAEPGR